MIIAWDTCCIDKINNVELQEAIISMFRWYRHAARCYAYPADVPKPALDADDSKTSQPRWKPAF
ncbi:hypothetical protein B0H67DRAFT_594482 [Lasiosphaeris hirsuta]|uniref:Uncharacterized protein n=1 Tax=Lasiosphaeris hirsuta TaxID=260670 RepID=A0AA40DJM3_9PEZI|nr:hypothetical protein B0H67DRAFT_594482 [Lasiosphaeris hirsuta]